MNEDKLTEPTGKQPSNYFIKRALLLFVGTLLFSHLMLSSMSGAYRAGNQFAELLGFGGTLYFVTAFVGLIAYGIKKDPKIALIAWAIALFAAMAFLSLGLGKF